MGILQLWHPHTLPKMVSASSLPFGTEYLGSRDSLKKKVIVTKE